MPQKSERQTGDGERRRRHQQCGRSMRVESYGNKVANLVAELDLDPTLHLRTPDAWAAELTDHETEVIADRGEARVEGELHNRVERDRQAFSAARWIVRRRFSRDAQMRVQAHTGNLDA